MNNDTYFFKYIILSGQHTMNYTSNYTMFYLGSIGIAESLVGITLNFLTLCYFISQRHFTVSSLLYISFNICDLAICAMIMPVGITNLQYETDGEIGWFRDNFFCMLWGVLWSISIRMSVYIIGVLSISRTWSHVRPLRPVKKKIISHILFWYLLLLTLQSFIPFFYGKGYYFNRGGLMCVWELSAIFPAQSLEFKTLFFITIALQLILPAIPIIASCFVTVLNLQKQTIEHSANHIANSTSKRRATKTVMILTAAYAIFNIPLCVILSQHAIYLFCNACFEPFEGLYFIEHFFSTHVFAINAIANASIYFSRIKDMKLFVIKCGLRLFYLNRTDHTP